MRTLYVRYDQPLVDEGFRLAPAKEGDAGLDLPVVMNDHLKIMPHRDYYINRRERWFDIPAHGQAEVPCGMAVKIPDDAWGDIRPRSSTKWKRNLDVSDATIDSGYTGPLYVLVSNHTDEPIRICEFDRLAQLVLKAKYPLESIEATDILPTTVRGSTGFGSSGGIKQQGVL
jgi:dUTP pyrophosphatase